MGRLSIEIDNRKIGGAYPPYVIAELSANHNGSLERALRLIETAKKSGADAVKIQTYTADTMTIDCAREEFVVRGGLWDGYTLYDLYKTAQTPPEWHKIMFDRAREIGITLFSTPFDESGVDLLENLGASAYKIASFEINDLELVRRAASTKKPLIVSTGMASEEEIEESVNAAIEAGGRAPILLHCVSAYPTPLREANLRRIERLARRFKTIAGLSDHTKGISAAIASVAMGASVIEKHFTDSRKNDGVDSGFSVSAGEFKRLSTAVKEVFYALGDGKSASSETEQKNLIFRRSLYFILDLKRGETIRRDHIGKIRPGYGLPPKMLNLVVGRKASRDIARGTAVSFDLVV
ncbi:MAG: pseudaminic acid synthase [Helicobacteraceae bacterium]|jgi:N-acetylneuraminate synthase|nr:pseudaminic acid synthase [Helicobacteraceae bacterium]